jgi:hypothetical protein
MGSNFWDENPDEGGGSYVGEDEKNDLIANGIAFPIIALRVDDHPQYGERFAATVILQDDEGDDEERVITFPIGSVESRDRVLGKMEKFLEDPKNDPPLAKLERVGRSILVRNAEAQPMKAKAPAKTTARKPAAAKKTAARKPAARKAAAK